MSQLWINWHAAHSAADAKEFDKAYGYMTNVMQNYNLLDKPDRLKDYPEDLHKWFDDTKPYPDGIEWLTDEDRQKLFEGNTRKVYPHLKI